MDRLPHNLSLECTGAVFDIVQQLGNSGLLDPGVVQRVLDADSEELSVAVNSFGAHARALGPLLIQSGEVEIRPEVEAGRDAPINTPSRRVVGHLIGMKSSDKEFWRTIAVRQGQAWDFGEVAIRDYKSFRTFREGSDDHIEALRLYMRGYTDAESMKEVNTVSAVAIKAFRSRFPQLLQEHHRDGVHTLRRQFADLLDADQLAVLRAAFPESFTYGR